MCLLKYIRRGGMINLHLNMPGLVNACSSDKRWRDCFNPFPVLAIRLFSIQFVHNSPVKVFKNSKRVSLDLFKTKRLRLCSHLHSVF